VCVCVCVCVGVCVCVLVCVCKGVRGKTGESTPSPSFLQKAKKAHAREGSTPNGRDLAVGNMSVKRKQRKTEKKKKKKKKKKRKKKKKS
jgi:hypothetical protein